MASASRAILLSRASPLHAAASRFLRPLAAAGSLLLAALVPSPAAAPWAAARRFATKPASAHHNHSWRNGRHPSWWRRKAQHPQDHGPTTPASDIGRQRPMRGGWFIAHDGGRPISTLGHPRSGGSRRRRQPAPLILA
ncbi:hypothetical protein D1007_16906 [Hordeum vulgare]|nr:hypothetical protein D1007_16906 [Hordeum vulgare]